MKIFYFCVSNKLKSYQFSHLKDRNYCFVVSQKLVTIHIVPRSARSILKVKVRSANPCYAWKVKKPNSIPLTSQLIRIFAWKSEFSETDEGEGRFVQLRTRKLPNAWNFLTLYNFVKKLRKGRTLLAHEGEFILEISRIMAPLYRLRKSKIKE